MIEKTAGAGGWPFTRIGGLAAIGFALIILGANLLLLPSDPPRTGAEIDTVAAYFTDHGDFSSATMAIVPLAWALATVFGASAVAACRSVEYRTGSAWALVGFAGLLLQNGAFALVVALRMALTATPDHTMQAIAGLWTLHDAIFGLNSTFLALALLGLSLAGRGAGLLQPWHATLGLIAAAGQFTSALLTPVLIDRGGPLTLIGLISWLMWVVWLIAYGLTLFRLPTAAAAAQTR
ncbi:hypothetical protein [Nocardia crassostreae]|uniref:hypothetical protein n=1 Tax=Nocardia crassostreae TaxID=53428 RepID=UPI000833E8BA|nr:hypothetical protein [Nocardia crassostreae]